jgi:hypothetical protein
MSRAAQNQPSCTQETCEKCVKRRVWLFCDVELWDDKEISLESSVFPLE